MITFECPGCKARIEVSDQYQGRQARCPTCNRKLRVPKSAAPSGEMGGIPADEASKSGTNFILLEGRAYQVRPQLDGFAVAAAIVVAISILPLLVVGLTMPVYNPWLWAGISAAAVALFGTLLVLPAQMSITRSRGRKGGRTLALITLLAGGLLVALYLTIALVSSLKTDYSACPERLRMTYSALVEYAQAHNGDFPPQPETLVNQGLLSPQALSCPHSPGARAGYPTYLRGSDGQNVIPWQFLDFETRQGQSFPTDLVILFDGGVHRLSNGQRAYFVLLLNGDVRHVPEAARDDVIRQQRLNIRRIVELRRMIADPSQAQPDQPSPPPEPIPDEVHQ